MCVPHPADHSAATCYKPNEAVTCSSGERLAGKDSNPARGTMP